MLPGLPAKEPDPKQVQVAPMLVGRDNFGAAQHGAGAEARGPAGQKVAEFVVALEAERKWHGYM